MDTCDQKTRWLVCAGAGQYLGIAAKLVGAGFTEGIDWEPQASRALARLAQASGEKMGVIVAQGCAGRAPAEVARLAAGSAGSQVTILCEGQGHGAQSAGEGEVCVEPERLLATLVELNWPNLGKGSRVGAQGEGRGQAQRSYGLRATGSIPRMSVPVASSSLDAGPGARQAWPEPPWREEVPPYEDGDVGIGCNEEDAGGWWGWEDPPQPAAAVPGAPAPGLRAPAVRQEAPELVTDMVDVPVVCLGTERHVPTVCVASARGGVGKSAIATAMALSLARSGLSVALLDLDYQFGTCLGYLGAQETDGLADAVALAAGKGQGARLDAQALRRCCAQPEDRLLAYEFCRMPERGELLVPITRSLMRAAEAGADVVVADLPAGFGEAAAQAFELSDRCLLVADKQALSLESVGSLATLAVRAGIPLTKLVCVMNRCDARHRDQTFLSRAQFEVQTTQLTYVLDGGEDVARMLGMGCAGELFGMRNRMALSAADLASTLCADLGVAPRGVGAPQLAGTLAPAVANNAAQRRGPRAKRLSLRRQRKEEALCLS